MSKKGCKRPVRPWSSQNKAKGVKSGKTRANEPLQALRGIMDPKAK